MATLKTKPYGSGGVDTAQLDINRLGYYSYAKTSSTTAKFYDDSSNYAQFTGPASGSCIPAPTSRTSRAERSRE
jgi:hypothetical protein